MAVFRTLPVSDFRPPNRPSHHHSVGGGGNDQRGGGRRGSSKNLGTGSGSGGGAASGVNNPNYGDNGGVHTDGRLVPSHQHPLRQVGQ